MEIIEKINRIKKARTSSQEILIQYIIENCIFDDFKSTKTNLYWEYDNMIVFKYETETKRFCVSSVIRQFLNSNNSLSTDEIKTLIFNNIDKNHFLPEKITNLNYIVFMVFK